MGRALLIIDHGTRSADANGALAEFAARVAEARPDWRVAHAHMELGTPDVPSAIGALVRGGATEIHVHLHFLGRGMHVRETIPELLEAARNEHPTVDFRVGDALGEDPRLVDLVVTRLDAVDG